MSVAFTLNHWEPLMAEKVTADQRFEIGEVAIACNMPSWPELVGTEVTIVGPLELAKLRDARTGKNHGLCWAYDVRWPDGMVTAQQPYQLRKKRPPKELLGEWELIPWQRPVMEKTHG